jgi:hypothetical protein
MRHYSNVIVYNQSWKIIMKESTWLKICKNSILTEGILLCAEIHFFFRFIVILAM